MRFRRLMALGVLALVAGLVGAPSLSLAYERRTIAGGKYDVVVGWDTEPAFVNQRNAAGIRIARAGTNPAEPVLGADKTLQLRIRLGTQSRQLELRPVVGQPGYYVADLLPTRAGEYVWTFTGSLNGDPIDETFDPADGKLGVVAAASGIQFPVAAPDPDQVALQLQASEALAQRALVVAYVGVGLGVLGLVAALVLWLTRPRHTPGVLSTRDAAVRRVPGAGV
jgi:hypothetical protein